MHPQLRPFTRQLFLDFFAFFPPDSLIIWPSPGNLHVTSNDQHRHGKRVPGLPIRKCAGSSNNLVPKSTKVSAIDVTPKVFFESLYWFQDWAHLSSESTVRVLPHPHCSMNNYFSIYVQCFSDAAPHFLSAHYSPSNIDNSWYPRREAGKKSG